jgi:hypothetical protein
LDAKANERRAAIGADTPWHARMKEAKEAGDQTKLDDLRARHAPLHDRMTKASEAFGEAVAAHAVRQHYPDAEQQKLAGPKNGNDRFDQVWKLPDGRFVVVEAKSSMQTELGERRIAAGGTAMQMSRPYFLDILRMMRKRGLAGNVNEGRLARELRIAYSSGKVEYVLVKGDSEVIVSEEGVEGENEPLIEGRYTGYRMVHYDIRPEVPEERGGADGARLRLGGPQSQSEHAAAPGAAAHDEATEAEEQRARQASQDVADRVTGMVERGADRAKQQVRGQSSLAPAREMAAIARIEDGKNQLKALIGKIAAGDLARPDVFHAWRATDGFRASVEVTVGDKVERVMFFDGVEYPLALIEKRVLAGHDLLTIVRDLAGENKGGIPALRARLDAMVDAAYSRERTLRTSAGQRQDGRLDTAVQALRKRIDSLVDSGFRLDTYQELLRAKSTVTIVVSDHRILSTTLKAIRYEMFDFGEGVAPRLEPMSNEVNLVQLTREIESGERLAASREAHTPSYRPDMYVQDVNEARALGMKALLEKQAVEEINAAAAAGKLSPAAHTLWQRIRGYLMDAKLPEDQRAALELRSRINRYMLEGFDPADYEAWHGNTQMVLPLEVEHGEQAGSMVLIDGRLIPRYSGERELAIIEYTAKYGVHPATILGWLNRISEGHVGVPVETAEEAIAREEPLSVAVERIRQEVSGALDDVMKVTRADSEDEAALKLLQRQISELMREGVNPDVYAAWQQAERYTHVVVKDEDGNHYMTVLDLGADDLRTVPSRSPEEALEWIHSMITDPRFRPWMVLDKYLNMGVGGFARVRSDDPAYAFSPFFDASIDPSTQCPRLVADGPAMPSSWSGSSRNNGGNSTTTSRRWSTTRSPRHTRNTRWTCPVATKRSRKRSGVSTRGAGSCATRRIGCSPKALTLALWNECGGRSRERKTSTARVFSPRPASTSSR